MISQLEQFQFTVEHLPRKYHMNADGLTKRPQDLDLKEAEKPEGIINGFRIMNQAEFDKLPIDVDHDKKGQLKVKEGDIAVAELDVPSELLNVWDVGSAKMLILTMSL